MIETRFKQTEIGLIPEDWEVKALSDILSIGNGRDYKHLSAGDVPVYGTGGQIAFVSDYLYEGETVCIGRKGTIDVPQYHNGRIWTVDTLFYTYNFRNVNVKFIYYLFCSIKWNTYNEATGVPSLTSRNILNIEVPLPQKLEQQRIAEALSNIDKLITSLSKIIEKKRLIKRGAMQQLLTGKKRLPGFDGEWVEKSLGEIGITYNGIVGKTKDDFGKGDAKYIAFLNILNNPIIDIAVLEKVNISPNEGQFEVQLGDLFFNTSSETPEEVGICSCLNNSVTNVYLNSFCFGFRLIDKSVLGLFLSYYFRSEQGRTIMYSLAQGSTRYNLSKDSFRKTSIVVPSTIQEQTAIVEILTTMDNEIESLEEERDKYIRLKEGMMQKLLTGQIRLVEAETKQQDLPKAKAANVYFKRSVLAAEIADRLCEEPTFGHVKMEKLIFLTEHLCHIDIDSHYHRDAAGPYDNRALHSIDSQMKKQKWFEAKKEDKGYRYIPMQNRGGHKKYFEKYYADVLPMFEKIIDTFRSSTTEQCEIVATLYSAWDDLLQSHKSFTDDDILNEVLNNWHESKKRIRRNRWQTELDWMRANGFVPQTENN